MAGPRLMAFNSLLTGQFRLSRRDVQLFNTWVFGMKWSPATIKRMESTTSQALEPAHKEVGKYIQQCPVLGMDETPWKESNKSHYLWCARNSDVAYYKIAAHRNTETAKEILGPHFNGALGTDRLGSYGFHEDSKHQHCLAHLDRDFEKIAEREGESKDIGEWGRLQIAAAFRLHDRFKAGEISRPQMQEELKPIKSHMSFVLERGIRLNHSKQKKEQHRKTGRTCAKVLDKFECLWVFAYVEGVEPTNNGTERDIRPGVRLRRVSFGTQSHAGSRFVERILTATQTCKRQGRNVLEFLVSSVKSLLDGTTPPSLLPASDVPDG
jgi:hypothetical protein